MGLSSKSTNNSFVRIFNFATVPAHVMGTLYSSSGSFTPVGFDSITIPAQKVIEVPIPNVSSTGEFAIQLSSDQPIVAGAFIGSQSSFTWFPSEAPMPAATITLPSIQPVIQLLGSHIQLQVSWISTHTLGQLATRGTHTISGSGFISWTLPQAVTQMTLTPISGGGQSVGAILTANGEKVVVPISIGAGPTPINRSTPIPDARIISRG